jgi:hypothetical protein
MGETKTKTMKTNEIPTLLFTFVEKEEFAEFYISPSYTLSIFSLSFALCARKCQQILPELSYLTSFSACWHPRTELFPFQPKKKRRKW